MRSINEGTQVVNVIHKWAATALGIGVVTWGMMAYYVQAEDNQTRIMLQAQIDILNTQQEVNTEVGRLVIAIDKKLSNIEASLQYQATLIEEVKGLRTEVNKLKLELVRVTSH